MTHSHDFHHALNYALEQQDYCVGRLQEGGVAASFWLKYVQMWSEIVSLIQECGESGDFSKVFGEFPIPPEYVYSGDVVQPSPVAPLPTLTLAGEDGAAAVRECWRVTSTSRVGLMFMIMDRDQSEDIPHIDEGVFSLRVAGAQRLSHAIGMYEYKLWRDTHVRRDRRQRREVLRAAAVLEMAKRVRLMELVEESEYRIRRAASRREKSARRTKSASARRRHERAYTHRALTQRLQALALSEGAGERAQVRLRGLEGDASEGVSSVDPQGQSVSRVHADSFLDESGLEVEGSADDVEWISMLGAFKSHLATLAESIKAAPTWVVDVVLLLDSLWTATGPRQVLNALLSFARRIGAVEGPFQTLWDLITSALKEIPRPQSSGGVLEFMFRLFKGSGVTSAVSALWAKVIELCGLTALSGVFCGLFSMVVPESIMQRVRLLPLNIGDFENLFVSLRGLIEESFRAMMSWASGKPHEWFKGNSLYRYTQAADALIDAKVARSEFIIEEGFNQVKAVLYEHDLQSCLDEGDALATVLGGASMARLIVDRQSKLRSILMELKRVTSKLSRVARPFVVALSGCPGQGKSLLASMILDEIAEARGLFPPGAPKDATPLTWFPANAKHADGYGGRKLVMMDDIGAQGKKSETTIEEVRMFMRFSNNIPTVMPMADVVDKGKYYSDVYGVLLTSNEPLFGFDSVPHSGAAIRRVSFFVKLQVKTQYAMDGNPQAVDPGKVPASDRAKVWVITVRKYGSLDKHPFATPDGPVVFETDNVAAFMRFIRHEVKQQHEFEKSQLKSLTAMVGDGLCSVGVRVSYHSAPCCPECDFVPSVDAQGWVGEGGFRLTEPLDLHFPGLRPRWGPGARGVQIAWNLLDSTRIAGNRVWRHYFPEPTQNIGAPTEWTDALRGGAPLSALTYLWRDLALSSLFMCVKCSLALPFVAYLGPWLSFAGLGLCNEILYGTITSTFSLRVTWGDVRVALLGVWMQCDFLEACVISLALLCGSPERYSQALGYLWRRPSAMRAKLITTGALTALGIALACVLLFAKSRIHRVEKQGAVLDILTPAWSPRPLQPWANRVDYYQDPTVGALKQIDVNTVKPFLEARSALFRFTENKTLCNAFALTGDVFLLTTHTLPPPPFKVTVCYMSRRQFKKEGREFVVAAEHIKDIGGENSLVRLVGAHAVPSVISLFPSRANDRGRYSEVGGVVRLSDGSGLHTEGSCFGPHTFSFSTLPQAGTISGNQYVGEGRPGWCGSIVYARSPRVILLGVHVGGAGKNAYTTRVSAEYLAEGVQALQAQSSVPAVPHIGISYYTDLAEGRPVDLVPHVKSAFVQRDVEADFLYHMRAGSANPRTRVCPTTMAPHFSWLAQETGLALCPPVMSPGINSAGVWVDPGFSFMEALKADKGFDLGLWRATLDGLLALTGPITSFSPLNDFQTLNGTPGRRGLVKLNLATAAGGMWQCKKSDLFECSPLGVVTARPEVSRAWKSVVGSAAAGEMPKNFFTCSLKDEPISVAKASTASTRVIQVPDVALTLALRQYASMPLLVAMGALPEVAIGINCYSAEGTEWVGRMRSGCPGGQYMDVDIKQLDRSFGSFDFLLCIAYTKEIARRGGYTCEQQDTLEKLLFALYHPVYSYRGSFFVADSLHSSGHPLTVMWNSVICLSLYVRWYLRVRGRFDAQSFRDDITLSVYGDDAALKSSSAFTFGSLVESFARDGFVATPGRKEASSGVVSDVTELSFLKRFPRWHNQLECWVMALDKKSIAKMVSWKVASTAVSVLDQEADQCNNARWEAFLWGPEFYDRVARSIPPAYADVHSAPTLDSVRHRMLTGEIPVPEDGYSVIQGHCGVGGANSHPGGFRAPFLICVTQRPTKMIARPALQNGEPWCFRAPPYLGEHGWVCKMIIGIERHGRARFDVKESSASASSFHGSVSTNSVVTPGVPSESQPITGTSEESKVMSHVPVQFVDIESTTTVHAPGDFVADRNLVSLAPDAVPFVERPTLIDTIEWTTASTNSRTYPVSQWFSQTIIQEKLKNYLGIRGKLHLRFVINGTQMHYGRMLMALEPYPSLFSLKNFGASSYTEWTNTNFSQLRSVYLDPACNDSCELELPFIGRSEFYSLIDNPADTGLTNVPFCCLHARPIVALRSVGTSVDPVTIRVYAWFSEVSVVGAAMTTLVEPHSGRETSPGVISRVSGAVAGVAGSLANIFPGLRPLFLASEAFARAGAGLAGVLGLSAPTTLQTGSYAILRTTGHLSNSVGLDPAIKLTLDPQAQVSIDPRVVAGGADDDMLITSVAGRFTWLASYSWTPASEVGAPIATIPVSPAWRSTTIVSATTRAYSYTACGFMAANFDQWRGDMLFDIDVVASKFHSGRLRVYWVPSGGVPAASALPLTNYTVIIDVSTQKRVRVRVPYFGPMPYRNVSFDTSTALPISFNGSLVIAPETKLVAPGTVDDVQVMVFIAGASNLQFAVPTTKHILKHAVSKNRYVSIALAPQEEESAATVVEPQGGPLEGGGDEIVEVSLGPPGAIVDVAPVYHGENVSNLRQLLKRSVLYFSGTRDADVAWGQIGLAFRLGQYPYPGNWVTPPGGANSTKWTPLAWNGLGFLGLRGSHRWRIGVEGQRGPLPGHVSRVYTASGFEPKNRPFYGFANWTSAGGEPLYSASWTGDTESSRESLLEFEIPYASPLKWQNAPFPVDQDADMASYGGTSPNGAECIFGPFYRSATLDGTEFRYRVYAACGEDISLTWFVMAPMVDAYDLV